MSLDSTPPTANTPVEKPVIPEHIEHITTHDRVPGHENYYEKDGLRTYGDGEDHDHEPPMSFRRLMCKTPSPYLSIRSFYLEAWSCKMDCKRIHSFCFLISTLQAASSS